MVRLTGLDKKAARASISCRAGRSSAPAPLPVFGSATPVVAGGPPRPRVLCYGDSNTVGFCQNGRRYQPYGQALSDALAAAWTPCEVTACGLCGLTAKEMVEEVYSAIIKPRSGPTGKGLARLLEDDGPFDLVVIMAGTNDIGTHLKTDATQGHVANLHALCHEHGVPTVNVAPPQAHSVQWARTERQHLADLMGAWASSSPGVLLHMDAEELVPRSAISCWELDEIHFSAQGSNTLGRLLAAKIAAVLGPTRTLPRSHRSFSVDRSPAALRPPSPPDQRRSRSPQLFSQPGPSPKVRSPQSSPKGNVDNLILAGGDKLHSTVSFTKLPFPEKKVPEQMLTATKLPFTEKRVPEQMLTARSLPLDKQLQDKDTRVEWAAAILQKMQRKRVLHQRVTQAQEARLQAITVPKLQRKNIMANSAALGKVKYNEPCFAEWASLGKVICVV